MRKTSTIYRTTLLIAAAVATVAVAQQAPVPIPAGVAPPSYPQQAYPQPAYPQQAQDPAQQPGVGQPPPAAAPLSAGELEQLAAPIALYPDALLSQVLMASTYPLEIVQARRFTQDNANLPPDQMANVLAQQPWDPSVKSLINFPTVLQMLDEKLDWTIKLGDAFLAQQQDVMDTVQRLRAQAQAAGNLQSGIQQRVTTTPAPAVVDSSSNPLPPVTQYITIDNGTPDDYYVPVYDPGYVYGTWAYTNYRPFFWHPRGYVPTRGFWYGQPCRLGPAWGYAFGLPDWRDRRIDLDTRRNLNYNRRIETDVAVARLQERDRALADAHRPVVWQHEPTHRLGVSYRDAAVAQRYGDRGDPRDVQAREAYRGRDNVVPSGGRPSAPNTVARTPLSSPNTAIVPPNQRPDLNNHNDDRRDNNRAEVNRADAAKDDVARQDAARVQAAREEANRRSNNAAANDSKNNNAARPDTAKGDNAGRDAKPAPVIKSSESKPQDDHAAPSPSGGNRTPVPSTPTPQPSRDRGGAYSGAGDSGADARSDANRGAASRGPSRPAPAPVPAPAPAPARSAPSPAPSAPSSPAPARSAPSGGNGGGGGHSGGGGGGSHR